MTIKGITFENRDLNEYLKDKEQIKDDIERKKFFADHIDKHYLKRGIKTRFNSLKEKNGRVKHLGQIEKNKAIYEKRLQSAIQKKDYKFCVIICLCCASEPLSSSQIANEIRKFATSKNLEVKQRIDMNVRVIFGYIQRKELIKYCNFKNAYHKAGIRQPPVLEIKSEFRDILSIDDAMRLYQTPYDGSTSLEKIYQTNNKKQNNNVSEKELKMCEVEQQKIENKSSIQIERDEYKINIALNGDLHIHLHSN